MKLTKESLDKILSAVKSSVSRKLSEICQEEMQFVKVTKEVENDLVGIVSFVGELGFILLLMLTDNQLRKISAKFVGRSEEHTSELQSH